MTKHNTKLNTKPSAGFTLIELMVVMAIVGILASIAYPSYTSVMQKTRRQEAVRTLLEASQMMESAYAMNFNYTSVVSGAALTSFTTSDDFSQYYNLSASSSSTTFTLSAIPKSTQANDTCGTLKITQTGSTTASTSGCW